MNPISSDPTAPPPAPPQPPRSSFSCDRHPTEQFNGFCPSCLCERLTSLDNSTANTPSTSRRPSSVSAAIKSLFASNKANDFPPPQPKTTKPISIFPELRRTQSFSASKNEALSLGLVFEPQRKSCDVKNTLCSLFTIEDESKAGGVPVSIENKPSCSSSHQKNNIVVESFAENKPVFEESDNDDDYRDSENIDEVISDFVEDDEIRAVPDSHVENCVEEVVKSGKIVEEGVGLSNSLNTMKNHIDLDVQNGKKNSGGFWAAASVFSKKWQNWRKKQKVKKQCNVENLTTLPVEKPISRQFRETQSEIADYGFGRRSCDIDPRFSLDVGRVSFDGPRYSFDEPRASWDGHMVGRRSFSRMAVPPMVSVMEDVPISVPRADMQIPVEESFMNHINGGDTILPGGSIQTKEYYSESFSKRRKSVDRKSVDRRSIDRSGSLRKTDIEELRMAANVLESRDSNSNSLREDRSESFSRFRDGRNSLIGNGDHKESKKSSRRWSWRNWGFINRRNVGKDMDEDEKFSRVNGVGRSFSQSWQETGRSFSGDLRNGYGRNAFRSNSSVSWRNGEPIGGSFGSYEMNGSERRKKNEFVLEKNRSARFSPPDHIDNGSLRFYLAPMGSGRRGGTMGKIKQTNTHSIARSVLRIY